MREEMRQGIPSGSGGEGRLRRPVRLEEAAADGVPGGGGGEGRLWHPMWLEEAAMDGVPGGGGGEGRLRRPMRLKEEAADGVPGGDGGEGRLRRPVQLEEAAVELYSKGACALPHRHANRWSRPVRCSGSRRRQWSSTAKAEAWHEQGERNKAEGNKSSVGTQCHLFYCTWSKEGNMSSVRLEIALLLTCPGHPTPLAQIHDMSSSPQSWL
jgi:hypothetical protein